ERGAYVFANFFQPCHGPAGQGDGLVAKHGFPQPPPLTRGQTQRKTDGQFFQILTNGQNTMPSYATQLSREDRWKAILFVRTLQRASPPAASSAPALGAAERRALQMLAAAGIVIAAAGAVISPDRMWAAWLLVSFYAIGLGLAGVCFIAIQYTTGA